MDQTWLGTHKCHCGTNSFPVAARNPYYSAPCLNRLSSTRVKKEICHFDGFLQFTLHIGAKIILYFMANSKSLLEWRKKFATWWLLAIHKIHLFPLLIYVFFQFLGKSIKPNNLCKKEGQALLVTIGLRILFDIY